MVLGKRVIVPGEKDKRGNPKEVLRSTGPHTVRFLEEPVLVMSKNFEGQPVKVFKVLVEEGGKKYRWMVPLLNKEGQPNYLLERLEDVKVGDARILEMRSRGAAKYIDVRGENDPVAAPDSEAIEDEVDSEEELNRALAKEGQF